MIENFDALIAAGGAGGVSSLVTISALRVHINYLRETVGKLEGAVSRAHKRIDGLEYDRIRKHGPANHS